MVKFNENEIRQMGRTASGVRGINLGDDAICIGAEVANDDQTILIVTEKGYGKQTNVREFRETKRGSKGVKALNVTEKNGSLAAFKLSDQDSDVVIITDSGMVIRIAINQINTLSRATQGVKLINLKDDQKISTISIVLKNEIEEETEDVSRETNEEVAE